ncbi:hypothetical protein OAX78_04390 [Planctomycetota bacterium]|nr:hypothetical protein [Planctomycetota bacterium]
MTTRTKSKEAASPLLEIADLDIAIAGSRCPFCHTDVPRRESVACVGCLARHHSACWAEGGACSCCGGKQVFRSEAAGNGERTARRRPLAVVAVVLATVLGLVAGMYAGWAVLGHDLELTEITTHSAAEPNATPKRAR